MLGKTIPCDIMSSSNNNCDDQNQTSNSKPEAKPLETTTLETNSERVDEEEDALTEADASLMRKIFRSQLVQSNQDVVVQRKNPNSPLYSVKTFEDLNLRPELLEGIYAMGFNLPSKIQESALPALLADPPSNIIAQSQNGTGKTAAFVLACLSRINPSLNYPQVLVLSPTYELAKQTGKAAEEMAKFCPAIKFAYAVRGQKVSRESKITAHFLLGTPGTVSDWARRYRVFDPKKLKVFVLDEADVMISIQGHQDQSIGLHKTLDKSCQTMLFSATYTDEVMGFAELIVSDPVIFRLKREEESLDNIKQYYVVCDSLEKKYEALSNIYGVISIGQAIIFCRTRKTANWLAVKMSKDEHAVGLLSGELTVDQRLAILNRFRDGKEKVLITTNVCARGIDVEQVTVVVNFDLPLDRYGRADCETYLHRIGRAGRFGKSGLAINMIDGQMSLEVLKDIEKHFGKTIHPVDTDDVDELEKMEKRE